ncbi:hypothetical protein WJX74_005308 [Apatococcus lobatus]|uniref:Uncharacterized protein n=1 Tax=Apatococcus lobatus TaxID=904363 RepID=A0AAW1S6T4_9CHLO
MLSNMSVSKLALADKILVEKVFALQNGNLVGGTITNSDTAILLERLGFDLADKRIDLHRPQYNVADFIEVVGAACANVHDQRQLAHAFRLFTDQPLASRLISLAQLQQTLVYAGSRSAHETSRLTEKVQIDSQGSLNYHRLVQQYLFE